jgi:hypothetical protein
MRRELLIAGPLALALLAPSLTFADAATGSNGRFFASANERSPRPAFFQKGAARTVFAEPTERQSASNIEFFPRKIVNPPEQEEAAVQAASTEPAPKQNDTAQSNTAQNNTAQSAPTREALIEQFGDPTNDFPVKAQESAPKPFQGMMAALEAGDDELAFKYARQHVRYMGRLKERTTRAVGMMGIAMEGEGMIEPGAWQSAREFDRDRKFLAEVSKERDAVLGSKELDAEAQALLARAREMGTEEGIQTPNVGEPTLPPHLERQKVRRELAGQLPIDPGTKVQVFFFFNPLDAQSQQMGKELQSQFASAKGSLDLMAFALSPLTPQEEALFRRRTAATYLINPDGSEIARGMEVRTAPTTVFVSPRLNRAFAVTGKRSQVFVDEVINVMEGR